VDKERLNKITNTALEKGKLFGKDIVFTERDKEEIKMVANAGREIIDWAIAADPNWDKLEETIADLGKKGFLIAFKFPPDWLVNRGESLASIKVEKTPEGVYSIVVPQRTYYTYYYSHQIEQLNETTILSEDTLKGRSTFAFGRELRDIATLLKANNKI
jgi:hypothetical protein